jgi:hypothetical protein
MHPVVDFGIDHQMDEILQSTIVDAVRLIDIIVIIVAGLQ